MSQAKTAVQPSSNDLQADNGRWFPGTVYVESARAVGDQQWVADSWAAGKLPLHNTGSPGFRSGRAPEDRHACLLRSSTGNFKGYQFQDGSGLLQHYSHIEAIRTRSGLILSDTTCWSRGWAYCSKPRNPSYDHSLPLTPISETLNDAPESVYDIMSVDEQDGRTVLTFESGEVMIRDDS